MEVYFHGGPANGQRRAMPEHSAPRWLVPFIPEDGLDRWWEDPKSLPTTAPMYAVCEYRIERLRNRYGDTWCWAVVDRYVWPKPPADRNPFPRIVISPLLRWISRGRWA